MSKTILLSGGDIAINYGGKSTLVEGFTKVNQDVSIALMQVLDINQDFGSDLADINAPLFGALFSLEGLIGQKVLQAIDRLIKLQSLDRDRIGPEERISRIKSIQVNKLTDNFSFSFVLEVEVESGDSTLRSLELDLGHQLPSSLLAPGSTG